MRIVSVNSWGFLLEHDKKAFFVPVRPKIPNMIVRQEVKVNDKLVLVIAAGDLPFYINYEDPFYNPIDEPEILFVKKESPEGQMIIIAMVEFARVNQR